MEIATEELKKKLKAKEKSFFLIDVREPEEYEAGHLPGAVLIPWHAIAEKIKGIKKDKELILYCHTNNRARTACGILAKEGYNKIIVYRDGWSGWSAKN